LNFVLYELSTPFLNIHWFLDKLNMTGSRLQIYNGIALLVSFFSCRILWGNYQSLRIYSDVLTALQASNVEIPLANNVTIFEHPDMKFNLAGTWVIMKLPMWLVFVYLGSNTLLNFLNFYWFGKMVQTVRSWFQPKDEKLEDKKLEDKKLEDKKLKDKKLEDGKLKDKKLEDGKLGDKKLEKKKKKKKK
jgi:hypothetical protein